MADEKVTGFYAPGNIVDLRCGAETLVVAFGHKARHGKNTACDFFADRLGIWCKIYSFADALKREVAALGDLRAFCAAFGVPYDENPLLDDPLCPPPHGKQRRLLQEYGTTFRRSSDPDYWVRKTREQIEGGMPRVALLSDMRFRNEFDMVKSMGGVTVCLERPDFISGAEGHVSETELDGAPYDFTLRSKNLAALKHNLNWVFDEIFSNLLQPSSKVGCVGK